MAYGKGRCWWADGSYYEGFFEFNKRNRRGFYIFPGGKDRYIGDFVDDKRQGEGEMSYADGTLFVGSWENDVPNGEEAVECYPNGDKYFGRFKDGFQYI